MNIFISVNIESQLNELSEELSERCGRPLQGGEILEAVKSLLEFEIRAIASDLPKYYQELYQNLPEPYTVADITEADYADAHAAYERILL